MMAQHSGQERRAQHWAQRCQLQVPFAREAWLPQEVLLPLVASPMREVGRYAGPMREAVRCAERTAAFASRAPVPCRVLVARPRAEQVSGAAPPAGLAEAGA